MKGKEAERQDRDAKESQRKQEKLERTAERQRLREEKLTASHVGFENISTFTTEPKPNQILTHTKSIHELRPKNLFNSNENFNNPQKPIEILGKNYLKSEINRRGGSFSQNNFHLGSIDGKSLDISDASCSKDPKSRQTKNFQNHQKLVNRFLQNSQVSNRSGPNLNDARIKPATPRLTTNSVDKNENFHIKDYGHPGSKDSQVSEKKMVREYYGRSISNNVIGLAGEGEGRGKGFVGRKFLVEESDSDLGGD